MDLREGCLMLRQQGFEIFLDALLRMKTRRHGWGGDALGFLAKPFGRRLRLSQSTPASPASKSTSPFVRISRSIRSPPFKTCLDLSGFQHDEVHRKGISNSTRDF